MIRIVVYNLLIEHVQCIYAATDFESEDIGLHLKLLSLLENPAVIVAAAAAGDAGTLRDFLRNHPKEVCGSGVDY